MFDKLKIFNIENNVKEIEAILLLFGFLGEEIPDSLAPHAERILNLIADVMAHDNVKCNYNL